jgi:7,8-dihydropterin-6-yl-methyl-4-(beta-D-ribofuranosyl)aminobenzene 5'-phosphate synthase
MNGESILFDTGSGTGIVQNSQIFGRDLSVVKKILISHGHADHTGGLAQVLGLSRGAEIWGHPGIFTARFAEKKIGGRLIRRFAGIPYRREYIEFLGGQFQLERGFREVSRGAFLTGEVKRETAFEEGDPDLFIIDGETVSHDPITDDQSLFIKTADGLVVIYGCAHAGMINTLRYGREKTGEERVHAILGGTHLGFLSEDQLQASIEELKDMNPKVVAVSHCTGVQAACRLMHEFGERFTFGHVGSVFQFQEAG